VDRKNKNGYYVFKKGEIMRKKIEKAIE